MRDPIPYLYAVMTVGILIWLDGLLLKGLILLPQVGIIMAWVGIIITVLTLEILIMAVVVQMVKG